MSVFTPDFASVESNIPVFDKMRALVQVTGHKPFIKETKDPKTNEVKVSAGVQFNLELVAKIDENTGAYITEDFKGRTITPFKTYVHGEGGWKFSKPFLMAAAFGMNPRKQEQEANAKFQATDWNFAGDVGMPPEQITLGSGWNLADGKIVEVTLTKKVTKNDQGQEFENQEFNGWMPASV